MSDPGIEFFAPVNEATIRKPVVAADTKLAAGAGAALRRRGGGK